jgi:hypothetical protein
MLKIPCKNPIQYKTLENYFQERILILIYTFIVIKFNYSLDEVSQKRKCRKKIENIREL